MKFFIYKNIIINVYSFLDPEEGAEMSITNTIARYISDNHLTVSQITKDTGINPDKLSTDTNMILSSQELLILCSYLHIKPEELLENKNADI